jgi:uncharacterized protein (TIGR02391 family)
VASISSIDETQLEAICEVLGATDTGLTGSEIGRYLKQCGINDPLPNFTKRHRLYEALLSRQRQDGCANNVLAFIKKVMNPVLYHKSPDYYARFREQLNIPLAFAGYCVTDEGNITAVAQAQTLDEAEQRADRLKKELRSRQVHPDVLKFCRAELMQHNYFHAVLEATKSLSEKIREKTGLTGDAGELANRAFALGKGGIPFLAFNSLRTDTEKSEQSGLMNLFVGVFGAFRNPTSHAPKIMWEVTEQDALDLMTLVSLLHRRLDNAVLTGRKE